MASAWTASPANAAEEGLLGWWMLDEGQGQTAVDRTSQGRDGKLVGAQWAPAKPRGGDWEFDGIKAHVIVPHREELNLKSELTAMAWVFPLDLAGEGAFLTKGRDCGTGYMFLRDGARLWLRVATEHTPGEGILGPTYDVLRSDPILQEGRWQHVAAVYSVSSGTTALYYNGQKILERPANGRIVYLEPRLPLTLGSMSYTGFWNWHGYLRDVRLYTVSLNDGQIKEYYQRSQGAVAQLVPVSQEDQQASCPARIHVSLVDKNTSKPLEAKVLVKDAQGKHYWPKGSLVYGLGGPRQCFYAPGSFELPVPIGPIHLAVTRGFEYLPFEIAVEAVAGQPKRVRCALERLVDMPSKGWYGGEHHLHPTGHGGRRYDQRMTMANRSVICKAEGMDFAFWMGPRGHEIATTGQLAEPWMVDGKLGQIFITEGFVGQCCVEPIGVCGHRCVIGAPYWTVRGNPQFQAMSIFDQVDRQGGLCIYSHPYAGGLSLDKDSGLCFARELPVAVALGRARIWDLLCWGGSLDEKLRDWYRWLDLGFRLGVGGSTDCYMNNPAALIAPASNRTYVKAKKLAIPDLLEGYRHGRTVVTNGPLLAFTVNGHEVGDVIRLAGGKPQRLDVRFEAHTPHGARHVEVVQNGKVIQTVEAHGQKHLETRLALEVNQTCWLAVRCTGMQGKVFGAFAHTSPVYIQFGDMPMKPKQEDVEFFIAWLEGYRKAIRQYAEPRRIPPTDYAELLGYLNEAAGVYRHLTASPRRWTDRP